MCLVKYKVMKKTPVSVFGGKVYEIIMTSLGNACIHKQVSTLL